MAQPQQPQHIDGDDVGGGALRPAVDDEGEPPPAPLALEDAEVGHFVPLDIDDGVDSDGQPAHRDLKVEAKSRAHRDRKSVV